MNEVWLINSSPSIYSYTESTINSAFTSNGQKFTGIKFVIPGGYDQVAEIDYVNGSTTSVQVYDGLEEMWTNNAYRTVTFTSSPSSEVLSFLQLNAIKQ